MTDAVAQVTATTRRSRARTGAKERSIGPVRKMSALTTETKIA